VQLVTTTEGIGRVDGGEIAVLDCPWTDLGALLWERSSFEPLEAARVRSRLPRDEAVLRAPVPRPGKVWAVGLNYRTHAAETGRESPLEPMVFVKVTSSVIGRGDVVRLPAAAPERVDYEGEVAVVIGRRATAVPEATAWGYVAGITACNDVSARDVQYSTNNYGLAKSFDTFSPLGASLVSVDEYPDPDDIGLTTLVNGDVRQQARTNDLVFPVPALVAYLSRFTTLEPGDVISTGTPAGVGMSDDRYLRPDDVTEVRVERVLPLVNRVAAT
jgi:2-keto-4-pentenoate hydratase/2-oxohepta-3-ene-1,7-dioic acid hydratase in catechol pathway